MKLARARALGMRALVSVIALAAAYVALLVFPSPLFAHARTGRFLTVHADAPIPASADAVIADAEARVERSALFVPGASHDVYVCQSSWRWRLVSNRAFGSGAFAMAPIGRSVFTRSAHFDVDRLVGPSGHETPGERTLAYFLAHEITHTLTADRMGLAFFELPAWVREGYADYVGRGPAFDYEGTRALLLAGDRTLDPAASGLYLRYVLLVAHLLDREGWPVEALLARPPARVVLEARVREGRISPYEPAP